MVKSAQVGLIQARESNISGRTGLAELTGTAQSCVSLWENGFALADVEGTELLDSSAMALVGRALAVRGECVFLIQDDGLVPCSDWGSKRSVSGMGRNRAMGFAVRRSIIRYTPRLHSTLECSNGSLPPQPRARPAVICVNEDHAGLFKRGLNRLDGGCLQLNPTLEPRDCVR
jgi:hypothetical protein